jgi:hypothetical protein
MKTVQNNDTGSLHVGNVEISVGSEIQIEGEGKTRKVTYLMGKGEKTHACCKGSGPFPEGLVTFSVVGATPRDIAAEIAALQALLGSQE